jgi:hypothetical protein
MSIWNRTKPHYERSPKVDERRAAKKLVELSNPRTEIGNRMIALDIIYDVTGSWEKKSLLETYRDYVDYAIEHGNEIIEEQERQAAEIASDNAVFGSGVTRIVNNQTNGSRFGSRLCHRCGKFYPRTLTYCPNCNPSQKTEIQSWVSQGFTSKSSDNHEYHSYTYDGE